MKKEERIPCVLYLYLHYKIYEKTNGECEISVKEASSYLHHWRIPKSLRYLILKEMEKLKLLEIKGKHNLKLKRPSFDVGTNYTYAKALKIIPKE